MYIIFNFNLGFLWKQKVFYTGKEKCLEDAAVEYGWHWLQEMVRVVLGRHCCVRLLKINTDWQGDEMK
jgi:hypothetical protein